ncbi:hypothetical protein DAT35_49925 [Vitiosangium sp. GDMCC 1.1324]|nr:hypothetical protein DAT35_49925 [Vitiosangium sp. GDMCC 1.1324]
MSLLVACTGKNLPEQTENTSTEQEQYTFCNVQVAAIRPGLCRVFEKRMRKKSADLLYSFHTLRCGQSERICAQEVSCDCTQALPAHSCEPERAEHWPYEEGRSYTSEELTRLENQAPEPTKSRLGPKLIEIENGGCESATSVQPPEYGRCVLKGFELTRESSRHVFASIEFGKTHQVCGVPVACECAGYPPAALKE